MPRTTRRTHARARALQALYACDMRHEADTERAGERVLDDLHVAGEARARALVLLGAVARSRDAIDAALAELTTNWRLERLGAVERAVLRLGAAELLLDDTPPRVVIQEAVRLAERYGSETSARFVNGVLDALARHLGRL